MKIIEPSFEIIVPPGGKLTPEVGVEMLRYIERMARISHRSEDKQTDDSWKRFIQCVVIERADWSVVEHVGLTVLARVPRSVTHEWVRHRHCSFTQESTRFVNPKSRNEELEFIYPSNMSEVGLWEWRSAMASCEQEYFALLDEGWRPQEARSVLPNALAATIAVTTNLRNLRSLLLARVTKETHPDFKAVTGPLLIELKRCIPLLFDDIQVERRQIENLSRPR